MQRPLRRLGLVAAATLLSACTTPEGGSTYVAPDRGIAFQERLAPEDGAILSVVAVRVDKAYEDLAPDARRRWDPERWAEARASLEGHADLVSYSSDGLRIGSLLVRPRTRTTRGGGAVIYNRDGIADAGLDEDELLVEMESFARAGYVVAASAYRGNRLSQGVDEVGGDDVDDVLALVSLVQGLDGVDPNRVFMVGRGRGGLMTYRALEMGAPVRAAAVVAGLADVEALADEDPAWENGFGDAGGWPGFREIYGRDWDYGVRDRELERRNPRERSQDTIDVPILIVHGRLDEVVPVSQAQCVTTRVRGAGVPIENVVYGYGDHALEAERADWEPRVLSWIERHDARSLLN
ncbi:MAG: prolyl oligopeptidase family serine peptidase [Planctomycetota bacterium]